MSGKLTHFDDQGRARMVDVSDKSDSARRALARGAVRMAPETLKVALTGDAAKGDVRRTAELAGIMAAKRTSDLIPLCHPLPLSSVSVR
ncbi:MAG: cyclic pyranopterin monophosphate synthase MoaC, partial [Pseudomonadota bacterium]